VFGSWCDLFWRLFVVLYGGGVCCSFWCWIFVFVFCLVVWVLIFGGGGLLFWCVVGFCLFGGCVIWCVILWLFGVSFWVMGFMR